MIDGARDGIAINESRRMRPDLDADVHRFSMTLVSMGPADVRWFDENAPPDWRKHITARTVTAEHSVSGVLMVMAVDPIEIIKYGRIELALNLAHEIVDHCEPIISRYVNGEQVNL